MTKPEKSSNFRFIMYPESAPSNWMQLLEEMDLQSAVILHDKDEGIKPHYHVLIHARNAGTTDAIRKRLKRKFPTSFKFPKLEMVFEPRNQYKYMLHQTPGAKGKHVYKNSDMIKINYFDVDILFPPFGSEEIASFAELLEIVRDNLVCDSNELSWLRSAYPELKIPNEHIIISMTKQGSQQYQLNSAFNAQIRSIERYESDKKRHDEIYNVLHKVYRGKTRDKKTRIATDSDKLKAMKKWADENVDGD